MDRRLHKNGLNIAYVVHEGDIVNVASNPPQWEKADAAMDILDADGIPYGVVPGNHDEGSNYDVYFGVNRFCTSYPRAARVSTAMGILPAATRAVYAFQCRGNGFHRHQSRLHQSCGRAPGLGGCAVERIQRTPGDRDNA